MGSWERTVWGGLLVAAALWSPGAAQAADGVLDVVLDHPCVVSVQTHPEGGHGFSSDVTMHAHFTVARDRPYDIRAEGRAGFFSLWVGTKSEVRAGPTPIAIQTQNVPDWARLGWTGALAVLGAAGTAVVRSRRGLQVAQQQKKALEDELTEAQARAGLFPVDGSLPARVGPYKVLARLGTGGMAVVYQVETAAGDRLALKLPLPQMWDDAEFKKRFGRELKIATSLRHPHLVRIVDINDGSGPFPYPFLVMEWVRGQALNMLLRPLKPQPLENALAVGVQALEALQHVHEHSIVHRDIKPGNIMLTEDGQVKVMDFGIARTTDGTRLTGTEEMLGTPLYMAPEQIDGGVVDGRTDVYALGTVLFEMLAGQPPFCEPNYLKLTALKLHKDPPPLSRYSPSVDPALEACVMKMLARRPEDRYWTASDARQALAVFGPSTRFTPLSDLPGSATSADSTIVRPFTPDA